MTHIIQFFFKSVRRMLWNFFSMVIIGGSKLYCVLALFFGNIKYVMLSITVFITKLFKDNYNFKEF